MAVLGIRTLPDPILRRKTRKVARIDTSVQKLIDDMVDTLRADPNRVGLAAPQVGVPLRVAVIELPEEELITLVNPEIVKKEGVRTVQEGCLSIPGYVGEIQRAVTVRVKPSSAGADSVSALGRLTPIPVCIKGAVTIKMMSRTSMTSTRGVTLISDREVPISLFRKDLNL